MKVNSYSGNQDKTAIPNIDKKQNKTWTQTNKQNLTY